MMVLSVICWCKINPHSKKYTFVLMCTMQQNKVKIITVCTSQSPVCTLYDAAVTEAWLSPPASLG